MKGPVVGRFGSEDLQDLFSDRAILFKIDFQYKKIDWSSGGVLTAGGHEDMIHEGPVMIGIGNSMTWESVAALGTGMASDGDGGECYRIEKLGWVSKK